MAQFTLKLLTPSAVAEGFKYLETTISEFYNQVDEYNSAIDSFTDRKHTFCYSFNEKLSIHQNAQKEFSFSMLRYVWIDNVLELNPFASAIHNGSQLLLIDKFNNKHFFTVKDIKYKLSKDNITYDISCQDSFTYQLIRQQDGYSINNSSDSDDFIGAKSLDWWVLKKIKPECHISYEYVPLFNGLYQNTNGEIKTFSETIKPHNVEKILKPVYLEEEYKEYYEKIPFSSSGNASSVLISLGETIGMNINVAETINEDGQAVRYFWFAPAKKEELGGLKYSPNTNIQSFDFSHNGDSLTTVLNVEANTRNEDEYISLIPDVPQFFKELFQTDLWNQEKYYEGFFTSVCQRKVLNLNADFKVGDVYFFEDNGSSWADIELINLDGEGFTFPIFYNKIRFIYDNHLSEILFDNNINLATPLTHIFELVQKDIDDKTNEIISERSFNDTYNLIDTQTQGQTFNHVYLRIHGLKKEENSFPTVDNLILNFYRDCNEEELNFAEMADKVPWLESKLIDLNYFLKQKIISKTEYNSLMNIFRNELRIINSKIILHSSAYGDAVKNKVEKLTELTTAIDTLGAVFHAEVLEPLNSNKASFDITKFTNTYDNLKKSYQEKSEELVILDYGKLLTENFNNYFNAQQRFLKNIYEFKKYFNEPVCLSGNYQLCDIELKFQEEKNEDGSNKDIGVGFSNIHFTAVDSEFKKYDTSTLKPEVLVYENNLKTLADIIHKDNYQDYYYAKVNENDLVFCDKDEAPYNSQQTYYRTVYSTTTIKENTVNIDGTTYVLEKWKEDKDGKAYYIIKSINDQLVSLANDKDYSKMPEFEGFTKELHTISFHEIIGEYLYKEQLKAEKDRKPWKEHNSNTYTSPSYWLERDTIANFMTLFNPSAFLLAGMPGDSKYQGIINKENNKGYEENEKDLLVSFYVENFPVTSLRYRGPKHINKSYFHNGSTSIVQQVNSKGQTWFDYMKDPTIQKPSEYIWETTVDLVTPYNVASYYRQTVTDAAAGWGIFWGILGTLAIGATAGAICGGVVAAIGGVAGVVGITIGATAGAALGTGIGLNVGSAIAKYHWSQHMEWRSTGWNIADAFNNFVQAPFYEGYFFEEKIDTKYKHYWNFVTSPTAKEDFDNICNNYKYEVTKCEPKEEGWNITTSGSNNTIPCDYKHCFEYFGLTYPQIKEITRPDPTNSTNTWESFSHTNWKLNNNTKQKEMLTYKDGYLRFLKEDDKINSTDKYYILVDECRNNTNDGVITIFQNKDGFINLLNEDDPRISIVNYYPLTFFLKELYVSNMDFTNSKSITVKDMLDRSGVTEHSATGFYFTGKIDDKTHKNFFIIKAEDYQVNEIFQTNQENYTRKYSGNPIYDITTDTKINFLQIKDITKGLNFYASNADETNASNMIKMVKNDDTIIIDEDNGILLYKPNQEGAVYTHFYKQDAKKQFSRVYTITQAKSFTNEPYYYANTTQYSIQLLQSDKNPNLKVEPQIYIYEKVENEDGTKEVKTTLIEKPLSITLTGAENEKISVSIKIPNSKNTINTTILPTVNKTNVTNTTNGLFALMYRDLSDFPAIQQHAALIERELSLYWSQAYSASKSCEYFLPEFWLPKTNGNVNSFFNQIISLAYKTEEMTIEGQDAKATFITSANILDTFIPQVSIYSEGIKAKMPTFTLRHRLDVDEDELQQDDTLKRIDASNIKSASILSNLAPIANAFKAIGADMSDFFVEQNDYVTKTYYYVPEENVGGTLWKDVFKKITNKKEDFEKFSGNYIMIYNFLNKYFKKDVSYENYFKYKKQQSLIWDKIYQNYSNIVLERNYKNEDATTSKDLYNMSYLAFKGLSEPQRSYNITTINSNTLDGYVGQELTIGDGILIDAEEYYSEYDDIKDTLSQYLFITDISYDLRKDSDISLTVNSIKYEDKLIQRLVKLIK